MNDKKDEIDIVAAEINKIMNERHEKTSLGKKNSILDNIDMNEFLAKLEFENIQFEKEFANLKMKIAQRHADFKNPPTAIEKKLRKLENLLGESRKHLRKPN